MIEIELYEEKSIGRKKTILVKSERKSKNYYDNENIKYFTKQESSNLMGKANKYYRLAFLLLFETAARIEEIRALQYLDIDFDTNKLKIKTSKQKKQNMYRILPISDTLKALILQYMMENKLNNNDYILAKKTKQKPNIRQAFDKKLKLDCMALGIDKSKGHCHTWRHTRAIHLLESGVDIIKVQRFLGHASIQNTLIYLKYSNKDFDRAILAANKNIGLV